MFLRANLILTLLLGLLIGISVWASSGGRLDNLFGNQQFQPGLPLFEFDPDQAQVIEIEGRYGQARFEQLDNGVWWGKTPWDDRVDPRFAATLVYFNIKSEIIDVLPRRKVDFDELGLNKGGTWLTIKNNKEEALSRVKLGKPTPWIWQDPEGKNTEQTTYAFTKFYERKNEVYVMRGNLRALFDPGFKRLRDHRPLLLHHSQPNQVIIRENDSELTLERPNSASPWRITRPMNLRTSPQRIRALMSGLEKLTAVRVDDLTPINQPNDEALEISIALFESDHPKTLKIYPPKNSEAEFAHATVSDRPTALFHLPIQPIEDLIGLKELPTKLNDLRSRTLLELDRQDLASIRIISRVFPEGINISRQSGQPYQFSTPLSEPSPVNEQQLSDLFQILGFANTKDFASDAVVNLERYGLHQPLVRIDLSYFTRETDDQILFGRRASDQRLFATVVDTNRVFEIDENFFSRIATQPFQWQPKRIFDFPSIDITELSIEQHENPPPLNLTFSFLEDQWTARRGDQDLSATLNSAAARNLLDFIAELQAATWLPPDHPEATRSLQDPTITLNIIVNQVDEFGDPIGTKETTLTLSRPIGAANPQFYYARSSNNPNPFSIPINTIQGFADLYFSLIESED